MFIDRYHFHSLGCCVTSYKMRQGEREEIVIYTHHSNNNDEKKNNLKLKSDSKMGKSHHQTLSSNDSHSDDVNWKLASGTQCLAFFISEIEWVRYIR